MADKTDLHIVSFNVPYPPDYGGVIDVFYRLKALSELGLHIHLHCFEYNRPKHKMLDEYASKVTLYKRKTGWWIHLNPRPYIVQSRRIPQLLENLGKDEAPILFEGAHCIGFLNHPSLKNRKKWVRTHNIEWQYYRNLSKLESEWIPKYYAKLESLKLRRYEQKLRFANQIFSISKPDFEYFKDLNPNTELILPFHGNHSPTYHSEHKDYALFHGDLSVGDNVAVAQFLIDVFREIPNKRLILAGRSPKPELKNRISNLEHIELIANPSDDQMHQLIKEATVNVLWSFQTSGMKLKLINALFLGRFVIANGHICADTPVQSLCLEANDQGLLKEKIEYAFSEPWTIKEHENRHIILNELFNDQLNGKRIAAHL